MNRCRKPSRSHDRNLWRQRHNSDSNRSHNLWQFPYSNRPIRHSLRYRDPWPDNRNSLRCGHLSNRRTDRFNTRPHHNRNTHSSLPYNRKTMAVTHWQEPEFTPEDYRMQYPADEEINYNPKDYEEYPDFPQSMLEPKYSPYQTV